MDKSGDNIIQKIDYQLLAKQFVDFFYNKWITNPNDFISNGLFFEKSKMNINNKILVGIEIINEMILIQNNSDLMIKYDNISALDSGSRRIDIMVNGKMNKSNVNYNFTQYFLIIFQEKTWKIQNSILNIFI